MNILENTIVECLNRNESLCLDSHEDRITLLESLLSHLDYKTLVKCVHQNENSVCDIHDTDGAPMIVLETGLTAFDILDFPSAD